VRRQQNVQNLFARWSVVGNVGLTTRVFSVWSTGSTSSLLGPSITRRFDVSEQVRSARLTFLAVVSRSDEPHEVNGFAERCPHHFQVRLHRERGECAIWCDSKQVRSMRKQPTLRRLTIQRKYICHSPGKLGSVRKETRVNCAARKRKKQFFMVNSFFL